MSLASRSETTHRVMSFCFALPTSREQPTRPRQDAPTAPIRGGTISVASECRNAEFRIPRLTKHAIPAEGLTRF